MDRKKHIEAIEACRPNSLDLPDFFPDTAKAVGESSKLQRLANRIQNFDQSATDAMEEVEIPKGLAGRLHTALASPATESGDSDDASAKDRPSPRRRRAAGEAERFSLRQWIAISAGVAVSAACIIVAAVFAFGSSATSEMDGLVAAFQAVDQAQLRGRWNVPAPGFQLPEEIRLTSIKNVYTQRVASENHGQITLVMLSESATLLVTAGNRTLLPEEPLVQVAGQTGAFRYTAWSKGGNTYLLAVKNGKLEDYVTRGGELVLHALPAWGGDLSSTGTIVTGNFLLSLV